jgi:hypothetical protein
MTTFRRGDVVRRLGSAHADDMVAVQQSLRAAFDL